MRRCGTLIVVSLVLAGCSASADDGAAAADDTTPPPAVVSTTTSPTVPSSSVVADPATAAEVATFEVAPGTEQVTVTGAEPGVTLDVTDRDGTVLATGVADANGAYIARGLPGGAVVSVRSNGVESGEVKVMARGDAPPPSFHAEQRLPTDGLGYIETRDGTLLSASVWLPGPADAGPYPTVVEYSGYTPSDPTSQGFPDILNGLGYAYVGVNIRGTG
jgi:hypothetical protein